MPQMLRHIPTGDLYHYSELLFRRGDMEIVEETAAAPEPAPAAEPVKRTRKAKEAAAVEEPAVEAPAPVAVQSYASGDNLFEE